MDNSPQVCPSPPAIHLIRPLTGHPQCPRKCQRVYFHFFPKDRILKRQEVGKAKDQVVSREAPSGGARQGGSRGLRGPRTPSPTCADRNRAPPTHNPQARPGRNLKQHLPNLGFQSTDVPKRLDELPMLVIKPDLFWPSRMEEKVEKIVTLDRKPVF